MNKPYTLKQFVAFFLVVAFAVALAGLTGVGIWNTSARAHQVEDDKKAASSLEPPHSDNVDSAFIKTKFHIINGDTTYVHVRTDRVLDWRRLTFQQKKLFLE